MVMRPTLRVPWLLHRQNGSSAVSVAISDAGSHHAPGMVHRVHPTFFLRVPWLLSIAHEMRSYKIFLHLYFRVLPRFPWPLAMQGAHHAPGMVHRVHPTFFLRVPWLLSIAHEMRSYKIFLHLYFRVLPWVPWPLAMQGAGDVPETVHRVHPTFFLRVPWLLSIAHEMRSYKIFLHLFFRVLPWVPWPLAMQGAGDVPETVHEVHPTKP